jgi:hypothetical protein
MKVLIFTPTYEGKDYCLPEFIEQSKRLKIEYPNSRHIFIDNSVTPEYYHKLLGLGLDAHRVSRGNNSRESLARAQNYARKIALDEDYDYLFSLESDIFLPENGLKTLLMTGQDIVTGLYYIGDKDKIRVPCVTLPKFNEHINAWGSRLLTIDEWPKFINSGLREVQAGGMGCCLMHQRVLKKITFTYDPRFSGHSDIYFFNTANSLMFQVYVHTDVICEHQNSSWDDVKDR